MFAFSNQQPNSEEIDSSTPFVAASDGDLALLQKSLQHLSLPATVADSNGLTLLHSAASYNQIEVIRWVLSQPNIDVNAKDSDGDTPLHHCDQMSAAKILVEEAKVDYRIKNSDGQTALQVKEEEANEMGGEMDVDEEDEDFKNLEELVGYLRSLP